MAILSDNDLMMALEALGAEAVTVDGATVTALVTREFVESLDVEGHRPVAACRTSDVPAVAHGSAVVAGGTSYTVQGIQPGDDGFTRLILEEVDD